MRHVRPERPEHAEVRLTLVTQLVQLGAVVDGTRLAPEGLEPESVLRMEVRRRHDELARTCDLARGGEDALAVLRTHPDVDDEHPLAALHDPDVGDERHAPVGDDPHAPGDLGDSLGDDVGRGRPFDGLAHDGRIYTRSKRRPLPYTRPMGGDTDRRERGLDAFASQFGISRDEVASTLTERFGGRFAEEAIAAAGGAWTADVLSFRDRSLIVVTALIVQGGAETRLREHVRWAIEHGSTREEIEALVTLLAVYAGYPRASVAWKWCATSSTGSTEAECTLLAQRYASATLRTSCSQIGWR